MQKSSKMIWSFSKTISTSFRNMRRSFCSDLPCARTRSQHCAAWKAVWMRVEEFGATQKRSGQRITQKQQICISTVGTAQRGVPTKTLAILFRASWLDGHFGISSWLDFRCCFQSSSGFRWALSRVAVVLLDMLFLVSPALCKQSHHLRYLPYSFPCPFSVSAFALRSLPCFF